MTETMGMFIDTSLCIGCKACEVACHQWNSLPANLAEQPCADSPGQTYPMTGNSYDNTGTLSAENWRHVRFIEQSELPDRSDLRWLMMSDGCKHCVNASCEQVCPTGAIIRTEFGSTYIQEQVCTGCRDCVAACPFGVIHVHETADHRQGTARKCTFCYDRLQHGLQPACAQTCPTSAIRFGSINELRAYAHQRLAELQHAGELRARLYGADESILGGLHSFYLLLDSPVTYGLPDNPKAAAQTVIPSSLFSIGGAIVMGLASLLAFRRRRMEQNAALADA